MGIESLFGAGLKKVASRGTATSEAVARSGECHLPSLYKSICIQFSHLCTHSFHFFNLKLHLPNILLVMTNCKELLLSSPPRSIFNIIILFFSPAAQLFWFTPSTLMGYFLIQLTVSATIAFTVPQLLRSKQRDTNLAICWGAHS